MKIAIFGATGPTGIQVLQEALQLGHDVIALLRSPEKLGHISNDKLQIHKVDVCNEGELTPYLEGCDAVLSALGTKSTFRARITFYTDSMKSILSAMKKANVSRLVTVTSFCTVHKPGNPRIFRWFLKPFVIGTILTNMAEMEDIIESETTNINYTIVRPPGLVNRPSQGATIRTQEGQFIADYNTLFPRQDLALFMLRCLDTTDWDRKCVAISL